MGLGIGIGIGLTLPQGVSVADLWILATNFWRDIGVWQDDDVWKD